LHGKELSYNNVVDIDAALALAEEFRRGPEAAVAILKHNTPCGVGVGRDPLEAWERAYATDRESPFGGIVVSTRPWTVPLARAVDEIFTEVLIAPHFEPDALELLRRKKARRIVRWHPDAAPAKAPALRGVVGGLLVQDVDRPMEDAREAKVVTRRAPTAEELRALAFAWRVVKHVKSNAIAFTTAERTLALGGGQTSRVEPVRNARARAERLGISLGGSVLASDAFFPFADGLEEAIAAGATAVIQPGGSTRDEEVISAFGPTAAAARLEGSKAFTKELLRHEHVPTAFFGVFGDPDDAARYVREVGAPVVVKADGLASGKGVFICATVAEALEAVDELMRARLFGDAGSRVVVEEFLEGEEVSFMALT